MKVKYTRHIEFHVDQFGAIERRSKNSKISIKLDRNKYESDMQIVSAIAKFCVSFYVNDAEINDVAVKRSTNFD